MMSVHKILSLIMLSSLGGFGDKRDDEARVMMAGDWTTNSNLGRNGVRKCVCSVFAQ